MVAWIGIWRAAIWLLQTAKLHIGILSLVTLSCYATPSIAEIDWLWYNTRVINVSDRVPLDDLPRALARGGYELAGGNKVDFRDWYEPKRFSLYTEFRTALSSNFGLLWGFSTGEKGEKYEIDPALSLGLHFNYAVTRNSEVSMVARTWIWGKLREKTCQADYGQIAGSQKVNCRLAASVLPPKETLNYLITDHPDRIDFKLQYVFRF